MYKAMLIIGTILIWIVFPFLTVLLCALLLSQFSVNNLALNRFLYGFSAAAALSVPIALCKIWRSICTKAWGQPEEDEIPLPNIPIENMWVCRKCNTENSINYAQCKKCGAFKGQ